MDIDIDFADRNQALELFDHISASRLEGSRRLKHNTGVYFHGVPVDAESSLCMIPYDLAEERGYFKIDFLNVNIYGSVKDEQHLIRLMETEPIWELLDQPEFVDMIFHINGHSDICGQMKPRTLEQLAAVLAIIRPAKRHLLGLSWDRVLNEVWKKPDDDSYFFKKSHSFSYAMAVIVHMNLVCERLDKSGC